MIDARSHRLARVCRSAYSAELQGTEEAADVGIFCRGLFANFLSYPMNQRRALDAICAIPLALVTDAKDVYDKGTSDTPTYGAQKSLAFTVAWLRDVLAQPNTMLKWTATENMFVDCDTKDMDRDHMHRILKSGRWSVVYNQDFVKQKTSKRSTKAAAGALQMSLSGEPLGEKSPIFPFLAQLSASPGWHHRQGVVINVARNARSFRTPTARFNSKDYPLRTTYGRFDMPDGRSQWRLLEEFERYEDVQNPHALLSCAAAILISVFRSSLAKEEYDQLKNPAIAKEHSPEHSLHLPLPFCINAHFRPYAKYATQWLREKACCVNCLREFTSMIKDVTDESHQNEAEPLLLAHES